MTVGDWRTVANMKIYYRGYLIHEEIRSISYSVYGQRPERTELTAKSSSSAAMKWIDANVKRNDILSATRSPALPIYQAA